MKSWFPKEIGGEIYKGFGDEYQSGFVSKTSKVYIVQFKADL